MRRLIAHLQTTLDNRIANANGDFWEPFAWGETEQGWLNENLRSADTWVLSRTMYEAIVPWWDQVATGAIPADVSSISAADREFAAILKAMTKVVVSTTLEPGPERTVLSGDIERQLAAMKAQDGSDILLSCGPGTLGPLASSPGLIDEYLLVVHPAVLAAGPRVFDYLEVDLALELLECHAFESGAVALRYGSVATD